MKAAGSTGVHQKKGQYINKSLVMLGHVIWKLLELLAQNDDEVSALSASSASYLNIPYIIVVSIVITMMKMNRIFWKIM